jgi:hypothetical protein
VNSLFRDAIEAPQMPLRLVPEVLNPVDMVSLIDEPLRVIDPNVVEIRNVQGIIARKAVRVDELRPRLPFRAPPK